MSREHFFVSDTNPNDVCGGRGCACSPGHDPDCVGPFVVFPGNEMDSVLSPHVVLGANCLRSAAAALDGEILSAGETAFEGTAEELPEDVELTDPAPVDEEPPTLARWTPESGEWVDVDTTDEDWVPKI